MGRKTKPSVFNINASNDDDDPFNPQQWNNLGNQNKARSAADREDVHKRLPVTGPVVCIDCGELILLPRHVRCPGT